MLAELKTYVEAEKLIPSFHGWDVVRRDYLGWTSPLDIDGVTVAGLKVRAGAHELHPNEALVLQLEWQSPGGKTEQLVRVEWKPLGPHNNKGRGPPEHRFKPFRHTHVHRFAMNWSDVHQRLLARNLPIAVPIQDVDSFEEFLDIVAFETNIVNITKLPPPPWHRRML